MRSLTSREKALKRSIDALSDAQMAQLRAEFDAKPLDEPEEVVRRAARWYRRKVTRAKKRRMRVKRKPTPTPTPIPFDGELGGMIDPAIDSDRLGGTER